MFLPVVISEILFLSSIATVLYCFHSSNDLQRAKSVLDFRNFKPTHKIWEPIVLITITSFYLSTVFDFVFGKHGYELRLNIVKRWGGAVVYEEKDCTDGFAGET